MVTATPTATSSPERSDTRPGRETGSGVRGGGGPAAPWVPGARRRSRRSRRTAAGCRRVLWLLARVGEVAEFDTQVPHWFGSTGDNAPQGPDMIFTEEQVDGIVPILDTVRWHALPDVT